MFSKLCSITDFGESRSFLPSFCRWGSFTDGRARSFLRVCLTTAGDTTALWIYTAGPGGMLSAVLCKLCISRH